ncbi:MULTISPECIES: RidA family protein [Sanguibacter]|uniref:RidA family protein n=2 Tax=Sanguibacter TaxID=60919 RepID=A0A853EZN3_9MICO|nr:MULTISPECIES: RidA family protein [Sanguibacter]KQT96631.1 LysR family transcriptional regulator [Sanguibacter sp. Leaf3]MBF0724159.1 RidA family protein [Sanguibacter inulinus]NYS95304.1 RidA family protein [Sanguibacter inulinus]WPF82836.1 RidA family protein [Sanguibacter sp. 4.1]
MTSSVLGRLAELGLELPEVAAPVASYVPAVRTGRYVYTSGQLPFVDGALAATGKVGDGEGLVGPLVAASLARTAVLNALAAVASQIGSLDQVSRIVKVVGFVASDPSFTGQPAVVNGASLLLGEIFGEAGVHARSAVGVAVLPLDSPVEIELVVELAEG